MGHPPPQILGETVPQFPLRSTPLLASSVSLKADSVGSGAPSKQIKSVLILVNLLNDLWVTLVAVHKVRHAQGGRGFE